ncbi:MAG: hypothetical protein P4L84_15545 [Isosphaeraceae bacterium]|nr:hypothetical protein [Isosphaeraceae bacterium]
MRIKSAYFRAIGGTPNQSILPGDRERARDEWRRLQMTRRPGPHDIAGWAELLVRKRADLLIAYPTAFGTTLIDQATTIALRWIETLRYRSNTPYLHEIAAVREASLWFQTHYARM